jgi:tetratricopeptide (TPR) repeat protein
MTDTPTLGMVGLGRMGWGMTQRLREHGLGVVGFDHAPDHRDVESLEALVAALPAPRTVWVMLPAGAPTQSTLDALLDLLASGDANAAVQLLTHTSGSEPESRMVREALARAQFDAGMYPEAKVSFEKIVAVNPADDYAQFGLGLAAARVDDLDTAIEHLALAAAMRPDVAHYATALRGARATKAARR